MISIRNWPWSHALVRLVAFATCFGALSLSGCERKEKVLDIETPGVDVEVERNIDTGEVEVKTYNN